MAVVLRQILCLSEQVDFPAVRELFTKLAGDKRNASEPAAALVESLQKAPAVTIFPSPMTTDTTYQPVANGLHLLNKVV